jgi:hypothetical protein
MKIKNELQNMKYPIIIFKNNDKIMGSKNDPFCSPSGLSFFKNIQVIDSEGYEYDVRNAKKVGSINVLKTLKMFTPMIKYDFEIVSVKKSITLDAFKLRVMNHVKSNRHFWQPLGSILDIQDLVDSTTTFEEVISLFR